MKEEQFSIVDKNVASYKTTILNPLSHSKEDNVKVTPEWLKEKNDSIDSLSIMKGWWSEGQFRAKPSSVDWKTSNFRKIIQIIIIVLERVLGRKDASSFLDNWIPISH